MIIVQVCLFVFSHITWQGLIRDLINRRGHGRASGDELAPDNNVRVPLSNNLVVEKALGESTGIICIDDLVHELHTVGAHFDAVATFLWPFRLTAPKSKYQKKTLHNFDSREDYGDKGAEIEKIVRQML